MNLENFAEIVTQVANLKKSGIEFDVCIRGDNEYQRGHSKAYFNPIYIKVKNLGQLSSVMTSIPNLQVSGDMISGIEGYRAGKFNNVIVLSEAINKNLAKKNTPQAELPHPSVKFVVDPRNTRSRFPLALYNPHVISSDPLEETVDEHTYRYVGQNNYCFFCVNETHPAYKYLDKGFIVNAYQPVGAKSTVMVITNELTFDTCLCLLMLTHLKHTSFSQLQDGFYLNSALAKVLRIKLEKDLQTQAPGTYEAYLDLRQALQAAYERTANAGLLEKLKSGKLEYGTMNQIKLSKTSAKYEHVSIEAPKLLDIITAKGDLNDQTDIYAIIRIYMTYVFRLIESVSLATISEEDQKDIKVVKNKEGGIEEISKALKINGIDLVIKRVSANTRRYVNDVAINIEEIEQVCYRASCCETAEEFTKFLNSVNKMSLKWHDAIANGLGVKIHDNITADELSRETAPMSAPKLRFKLVDDEVHLIVNENKSVKVKFSDLLKKVATINRKTNGLVSSAYLSYDRKGPAWARRQLTDALIECCTFEEKKLRTIIKEDKTVPVLENGKKVYDKNTVCYLTAADAKFIEEMARQYTVKAQEREKIFLEAAVKATGATKDEHFKGELHYVVKGNLNTYAVNAKTNQVCEYPSGRHICIVEPGHQVTTGGDATAARLYALKADSMTASKIGTIKR